MDPLFGKGALFDNDPVSYWYNMLRVHLRGTLQSSRGLLPLRDDINSVSLSEAGFLATASLISVKSTGKTLAIHT